MAVFLITLQSSPSQAMEQAIQRHYPDSYLKVSDLAWLIDDRTSIVPQTVSEKLGDGNQSIANQLGNHIVSTFNGYYGYHNSHTWEWLRLRGL
ncbi:hypothetical protein ABXZ88_000825 [Vibrio fluvialis]|nr:hypothetical protein [Vibrio fluvialis]MCG6377689.1 hypothetical protein [Vibrio fluvialis]